MKAATDLAFALDRVSFASSLGLDPDPWQGRLLRYPGGGGELMAPVLCARAGPGRDEALRIRKGRHDQRA